jgi:hypothetical protein
MGLDGTLKNGEPWAVGENGGFDGAYATARVNSTFTAS